MFALELGAAGGWYALVVAGAVGLAWFTYRRAFRAAQPRVIRWLLPGLRLLSLLLVGLLLLSPQLVRQQAQEHPAQVALVLDVSRSAHQVPRQTGVPHVNQELMAAVAAARRALTKGGAQVTTYALGSGLSPLPPDSLPAPLPATNLARALATLSQEWAAQPPAATVLITDGIATQGGSPLQAALSYPGPLHTLLLGDSTAYRDLRIVGLESNQTTFRATETPLRVRVGGNDVAGQTAVVELLVRGQPLRGQTVVMPRAGTALVTFNLRFDTTGVQDATVRLRPLPNEATYANNTRRVVWQVLENRRRVLLLAGAPHPDVGALGQALAADGRFQVTLRMAAGTRGFPTPLTPADYAQADLLIVHNLNYTVGRLPEVQALLAAAQRRRMPVWTLAGVNAHNLPAGLLPLLALRPTDEPALGADAGLQISPGQDLLFQPEENFQNWLQQSPPLRLGSQRWQTVPGATVAATQRIRGIPLAYPLVAYRQDSGRRYLTWAAEGLWRMRMDAYRYTGSFTVFDDWVKGLAQWLTARADARRLRLTPATYTVPSGDPLRFQAELYDEKQEVQRGATLTLTLTDSAGRAQQATLAEQPGGYGVQLPPQPPGRYRYRGVARVQGRTVAEDAGTLLITTTDLEQEDLQAQPGLLRALARSTGGAYWGPATTARLAALTDSLARSPILKPTLSYSSRVTPLASWPVFWVVVLVLLAAEWLLRRRYGLF